MRTRTIVLCGVIFVVFSMLLTLFLMGERKNPDSGSKYSDSLRGLVFETPALSLEERRRLARESIITSLTQSATTDALPESKSMKETVDAPQDDSVNSLSLGRSVSVPARGVLYSCSSQKERVSARPWIEEGRWHPEKKPVIEGKVIWEPSSTLTVDNDIRRLTTDNLPQSPTGVFPPQKNSQAYVYMTDEIAIRSAVDTFTFPRVPKETGGEICVTDGIVGVTLTGVAVGSASRNGTDAVATLLFDECGGRADRASGGLYRYFTETSCVTKGGIKSGGSTLLGYALDGFGIFSKMENGKQLHTEDLDNCHGHTHEIVWDGESRVMYHYHMTDEFPYSVGCFRGEVTTR